MAANPKAADAYKAATTLSQLGNARLFNKAVRDVVYTAPEQVAAKLLKPGGHLVYATCSILPEENEAVVDAFAAGHPEFKALSCAELLKTQRIALDTGERLRLWPHRHGTDGFFAAAYERR